MNVESGPILHPWSQSEVTGELWIAPPSCSPACSQVPSPECPAALTSPLLWPQKHWLLEGKTSKTKESCLASKQACPVLSRTLEPLSQTLPSAQASAARDHITLFGSPGPQGQCCPLRPSQQQLLPLCLDPVYRTIHSQWVCWNWAWVEGLWICTEIIQSASIKSALRFLSLKNSKAPLPKKETDPKTHKEDYCDVPTIHHLKAVVWRHRPDFS